MADSTTTTSNVDDIINSDALGASGIIRPEYANQIIQEAPKASVMLTRARQIRMSTKSNTQPVLDSLPLAYWVGGETGLKQTTKQQWAGLSMTAEELAVIVPIPDAVIADATINLWDEVRPRLAAAIGMKFDQTCIFGGTDKPATFPTALFDTASSTTIGNTVEAGTGSDLGVDVATLAEKMAKEGYNVNGFAAQPGLNWQLAALRDKNERPIYTPDLQTPGAGNLYGYALNEVDNGAWDSSKAIMMLADWSNLVVGIRQDMQYKFLDQAVISDDDGKIVLNLAQQDCQALRVTFRAGFVVANPVTTLESDKTKRFPVGFVVPKKTTTTKGN